MKRVAFAAAALFSMAGCEDDFSKGWLVDRPRVLGARVEAVSDASRSSLVAGEEARVMWLVSQPATLTWAICAAPTGRFDEQRCATPLVVGNGATFTVPPAEGDLLMLAAFCTEGTPVLDAAQFTGTCNGAPPTTTALLASLVLFKTPNRNPAEIDTLTAPDACVPPGSKQTIGYRFKPEDREAGETMIASHFVTTGTLDRQYTAVEPGEAIPKDVTVPWTAPGAPGDVDLFFVLRDGRGGAAFVKRTICVK